MLYVTGSIGGSVFTINFSHFYSIKLNFSVFSFYKIFYKFDNELDGLQKTKLDPPQIINEIAAADKLMLPRLVIAARFDLLNSYF